MTLIVPAAGVGVRNRCRNPAPAAGGTSSTGWVSSSTGSFSVAVLDVDVKRRPGAPGAMRTTRTSSSPSSTIGSLVWVGLVSTSQANHLPVTAGESLWAAVYARGGRDAQARVGVAWIDANGALMTTTYGPWHPVAAGEWVRATAAVVAPDGATACRLTVALDVAGGGLAAAGDQAWFCDAFLSDREHEHGDGDTPGWRWQGAAHASESRGPGMAEVTALYFRGRPVSELHRATPGGVARLW